MDLSYIREMHPHPPESGPSLWPRVEMRSNHGNSHGFRRIPMAMAMCKPLTWEWECAWELYRSGVESNWNIIFIEISGLIICLLLSAVLSRYLGSY